jgi:predicted Fe-Mo cluster-binding NifX family protein
MKKQRTRIAMPVVGYDGVDSVVSGHFGRSRGFIVSDSSGRELTYLDTAKARRPSECAPIQALVAAGSRVVLANRQENGLHCRGEEGLAG